MIIPPLLLLLLLKLCVSLEDLLGVFGETTIAPLCNKRVVDRPVLIIVPFGNAFHSHHVTLGANSLAINSYLDFEVPIQVKC